MLILSLTIAKFLTALVSCATAITLLTLIPLLLKWKVRELFLKQNVLELDQEVGMMKKQKEASWHVRMLTQEIRKSLDRHTILYTTLVELSKTLDLHNCAVWMPNENRTELHLTHELKGNSKNYRRSIPVNDPDVLEIQGSKGVKVLRPDSALGASSGRELEESGAVAAIRMPMLQVSNFKGGTPELVDTCYAILKLSEQNHALQQARNDAMMASQARNSFQKVMSHGMRRPMHSILGLLSMFQNDNMGFEQRIVTDTLVKTGNVLATLINDVMDISAEDTVRFPLEMRPFRLHSMIKEASCLAKCLCVFKGFDFELDVQSSLPDLVIGDERRAFQVILHMVGYLLNIFDGGGNVIFRVFSESDSEGKSDRMLGMWKTNAPDEFVSVKFDMEMREGSSPSDGASSTPNSSGRRRNSAEAKEGLGFIMCKRLVQVRLVQQTSCEVKCCHFIHLNLEMKMLCTGRVASKIYERKLSFLCLQLLLWLSPMFISKR
ncbi:ethylene receptor family protein [Salix suchowensis]|nr:ethylene receptor family protein [Salix suchowensis]